MHNNAITGQGGWGRLVSNSQIVDTEQQKTVETASF